MKDLLQLSQLMQLSNKDIPEYRKAILEEQNGLCAICKDPITEKTGIALDHQHRTKASIIGENGGGLIRGVLCRRCNSSEGRIWNNSKRFGIKDLPNWLRSLADYLEEENYPLIHPNEKPKEPILPKRRYNKLKKAYTGRAKFPEYPKSKKITKRLQELFKEYEI